MCTHCKLGINPNYFRFAHLGQFTVDGVAVGNPSNGTFNPRISPPIFHYALDSFMHLCLGVPKSAFTDFHSSDYIASLNNRIKFNLNGHNIPLFIEYRCNKCFECAVEKRKQYTSRSLLQLTTHPYVYFVTLTYDEQHLPENHELSREHLREFTNRLLNNLAHSRIRYFRDLDLVYLACGEYGKNTHRPHYHLLLFSRKFIPHNLLRTFESTILDRWDYGIIKDFSCGRSSGACCKYVTKYITKQFYYNNFDNKTVKPFVCCSRRPAFGASPEIVDKYRDAVTNSTDGTIYVLPNSSKAIRISVPKILVDKIFEPVCRKYPSISLYFARLNVIYDLLVNDLYSSQVPARFLYGKDDPFGYDSEPFQYQDYHELLKHSVKPLPLRKSQQESLLQYCSWYFCMLYDDLCSEFDRLYLHISKFPNAQQYFKYIGLKDIFYKSLDDYTLEYSQQLKQNCYEKEKNILERCYLSDD